MGRKKISTRKRHLRNTLNPGFYESFEFPVQLPGDAILQIECWDWDGIGDDLIFISKIDIEDRYFTEKWRNLEKKPVEYVDLMNPTITTRQGTLSLWVEVLTSEQAKNQTLLDITPAPDEEYELRVVVWTVQDVPPYDEITEQSDLYVTGLCDTAKKTQSTDIHWRTKKELGNFNWRMKWPVMLPGPRLPRLKFQVYDKDLVAPDDSIAEVVMPLARLCRRALTAPGKRVFYTSRGNKDFWLKNLRNPTPTKQSKKKLPKMKIRVELVPKQMAETNPVGLGRSQPNLDPFLPPPEGRMKWSLNPIIMCYEMLGPAVFKKACIAACISLLISAICYMLPQIIANGLAF